jgi:hypothetical protein
MNAKLPPELLLFVTTLGAVTAVFLLHQLTALLNIKISARDIEGSNGLFIVRVDIENASRVRVKLQSARLQVLLYTVTPPSSSDQRALPVVGDWLPFSAQAYSAMDPEQRPLTWSEPVSILGTTHKIDPKEVKTVERVYSCPAGYIAQIGVQAKIKLHLYERLYARSRAATDQWTQIVLHTPSNKSAKAADSK